MSSQFPNPLAQRNADWLAGRATTACGDTILIADDSDSDIFFLLRAFSQSAVKNPIQVVRSGDEALAYLRGQGRFANRDRYPYPKIVFIDLKMPHPDGFEILRWKQEQIALPKALWVAMSNFDGTNAINKAYVAGATTFLSKPLDAMDVRNLIEAYNDFWALGSLDRRPNS